MQGNEKHQILYGDYLKEEGGNMIRQGKGS